MTDTSDTGTIGAMIDNRYTLRVHCNARGCGHHAEVDLQALADKLGRDHGAMHWDLVPLMRCSKCGSKDLGIQGTPTYNEPHN